MLLVSEKARLSLEAIESQSALELPHREMLTFVSIGKILSGNHVDIQVTDVNVATAVCANVSAINVLVDNTQNLWCNISEFAPPPSCP
jgi:hypothetical protein